MKKLLLIISLAWIGCSKSNDATTQPPVNTAAKVTVTGASVVPGALSVNLTFENSSSVASCQLVVYQNTISGQDYKYIIEIKDGPQTLICPKYSDASPMMYQIKYTMKAGNVIFSDPMYQAY